MSSGSYLLFLVVLVGLTQQADKYLFSAALEAIKGEFGLSDSQLGAINGPAFAIFFVVAGVPIARLAERKGRPPVIAGSVLAWSVFTMLTIWAAGFLTLFAARVFVGIGEAGCSPAVQSLIAARFPPEQRSGAMSVMYAGNYLGVLLGLACGGILVSAWGWRGAFLGVGIVGLLIAPLVWLTLRDAPRSVPVADENLWRDLTAVLRAPGMPHFLGAFCLMGLATYGTIAWSPAFYARYYGMNSAQIGIWVGFAMGGAAVIGSLLGAFIVGRLTRVRRDATPAFIVWTTLISIPPAVAAFLVHDAPTSLALLAIWTVIGCLPAGPIYAVLHDLVEPRHRAVAAAVAMLAATLIGGTGPFVVGVFSDLVGAGSREALRDSLVAVNVFNIWALLHVFGLLSAYRRRFAVAV